jgi:hypothetical protein
LQVYSKLATVTTFKSNWNRYFCFEGNQTSGAGLSGEKTFFFPLNVFNAEISVFKIDARLILLPHIFAD